jgi:hypothetical protein
VPTPDWNAHYCAGKGDHRRPEDVEKYRRNFDRIFRKPVPSCTRCRHFNRGADWCKLPAFQGALDYTGVPPCDGKLFEEEE